MFGGLKFSYENAKLRARQANSLSKEKINALLNAKSLEEAVTHLKGTYYEIFYESYTQTGCLGIGELAIKHREINTLLGLRSSFSGAERNFVSALASCYEMENLKIVLSIWFNTVILQQQTPQREFYLHEKMLYDIPYNQILAARDFANIPELLKETPYGAVLSPMVEKCRTQKSLFPFAVALDMYFYTHLKLTTNNLDASNRFLARRFFGTEVDFENLISQLRYKEARMEPQEALGYFLHGGSHLQQHHIASVMQSEQSILAWINKTYPYISLNIPQDTPLVRTVELYRNAVLRHIYQFLRTANPMSIAPVLAYYCWIRTEKRLVISLLEGIFFGIPAQKTEEILCLSQRP